jgi:hypothetical protein
MNDQAIIQSEFEQAAQAALESRFPEARQLLRRALAADPSIAIGRHANLAEPVKLGADLENVVRLAPFRINALVTTGWLNSVFDGRPVDARGRAIPWFTYPAIDFLEPRVRPNWSVLEWGCGSSTFWWAARTKRVVSVEHDPHWHQIIASEALSNATISLAENPRRYIEFPDRHSAAPFDAIVIDGEHRNQCARRAADFLNPDGIIIFDNSDRKMYREGLTHLMETGWRRLDFFGLIPSYLYRNCTSIFYRNDNFLKSAVLPCDHQSSLGPTCAQVMGE